jgi:hypothetical protein
MSVKNATLGDLLFQISNAPDISPEFRRQMVAMMINFLDDFEADRAAREAECQARRNQQMDDFEADRAAREADVERDWAEAEAKHKQAEADYWRIGDNEDR